MTGDLPLRRCDGCAAELPATLLACPGCGRLVHAEALKAAAREAPAAEARGDVPAALAAWRRVMELLPPSTVQHAQVAAEVRRLSERVSAPERPAADHRRGRRAGWLGALAAVGAVLAKLKFAILIVLSKAKLLLVGLAQIKTLLTMAMAMGVYTSAFGWRFAAGLIASMYVHEMGHVAALRRFGIPATAPVFIPGFGAFVRLKQHPATPGEDARVGLAGPVWGAAAAFAFLAIGVLLRSPALLAIARAGAWINLFNLAPVWQLDGGRAFTALSRRQRAAAAAVLWILGLLAREGLLLLLAIAATVRAFGRGAATEGDRPALAVYAALAVVLTMMAALAR